MEIWKKIDGYDNYEVSSYGRVRSKNKILTPQSKGNGYLQVNLCSNGSCNKRIKTYKGFIWRFSN